MYIGLQFHQKYYTQKLQIFLEKCNVQTRPIFTGNLLRHPAFRCLINNRNKLLINAFDIFVVDFKTINYTNVDDITSKLETLKQNNPEKKIYLFNFPEDLLDKESLKEYFFINNYSKNNNNKDFQNLSSRLEKLKNTNNNDSSNNLNYSSSDNYNRDEILNFATYKIENKGKRTLLICSNEILFPSFHKNLTYKNIDGIFLKNNIDVLFTIEKNTLRGNVISDFKYDTNEYTYYDNDNSITPYNVRNK